MAQQKYCVAADLLLLSRREKLIANFFSFVKVEQSESRAVLVPHPREMRRQNHLPINSYLHDIHTTLCLQSKEFYSQENKCWEQERKHSRTGGRREKDEMRDYQQIMTAVLWCIPLRWLQVVNRCPKHSSKEEGWPRCVAVLTPPPGQGRTFSRGATDGSCRSVIPTGQATQHQHCCTAYQHTTGVTAFAYCKT